MPWFSSEGYQRVIMNKNPYRARKNMFSITLIFTTVTLLIVFISLQLYGVNPNLKLDQIFPFMIKHYSFNGINGALFICIFAMVISTVDSTANSVSVLLTNDVFPLLNKKFRQIASYGKAIDARAANVEIVSNVRVNGNSKQALVCLWTDPETGALHTFRSQEDYYNKYYLVGQALRVYVNPGNLEEYIVDTSKVSYAAAVKYAANTVMNRVR
jgi:hypothetical protein